MSLEIRLGQLTPDAKQVMTGAASAARELGHRFIGCEHLLLAIASAPDATGELLRTAGITPDRVRGEILRMIGPGREASVSLFDTLDREALSAIGIDLDVVCRKVEAVFGPQALRPPRAPKPRWWQLPYAGPRPKFVRRHQRRRCMGGAVPFTPRAKECVQRSARESAAMASDHLGVEHMALALIDTKSSAAAHILSVIGVSRPALRTKIVDQVRSRE